jgi:membrane peptidoglycan carboxypeptidase
VKWLLALAFLGALALVIAIYITYRMIDIPNPNAAFQAQTTTVYYADGHHVLGQFALQNRQSIPLKQVPHYVRNAVISAENRSFRTDSGIDPKGIVRAAWNNLTSDSTQGASTITQQYVKVLYLSQERTWQRKIKEAFLAVKIDNTLTKNQILAGYLNTIYYGRGAYGIQAAAQAYFRVDARDLTVAQGAVLASVINSPGTLDPGVSKSNRRPLLQRYRYVLDGMVQMGGLRRHEAHVLKRHLPKLPAIKTVNAYGGQRGYLMNLVEQELRAQGFSEEDINGGGLTVTTTLDWHDMRAAVAAVKRVRPGGLKQLHVALASVEPGTGALRAMIGGTNYLGKSKQSHINWALSGGQPGSSFKPFALAAALKSGIRLTDTFDGNSPYTFPDGSTVQNEGESSGYPSGFSYGSVNLITATAESINTAYVDMTAQMHNGPQKVVDAAVAAGVPRSSPGLNPNAVVALGTATVPTVEMAEGYATFAAQGEHANWYLLQKITDASGVRFEHRSVSDRAFSPAVASNVTYALQQVIQQGTGQNALALNRPAAGKTGTATALFKGSERVSSSWFVGYTPQLSTAVMYVRGDGNDPLDGYLNPFFGANFPTQTWTAYMKTALQGQPIVRFPAPTQPVAPRPTYVPTTTAPLTTQAPTTTSVAPTTSSTPTTTRPTTTPPTTTLTLPTTTAPPPPPTTTAPPPSTSSAPTSGPTPPTTPPTSSAPTSPAPPTTAAAPPPPPPRTRRHPSLAGPPP